MPETGESNQVLLLARSVWKRPKKFSRMAGEQTGASENQYNPLNGGLFRLALCFELKPISLTMP